VRGAGLNPAQDFRQDTFEIPHYIQVAEAKNFQPLTLQIGRAQTVFRQASYVVVLPAIELDDKLQRCAVEVQNVRRPRMLPTKFESG